MRTLRSLLLVAISLMAGLSCGDANGPGGDVQIRMELTSVAPMPGTGFSVRVFATARPGDEITSIKIRLQGALIALDSSAFGGERSQSMAWDFPITLENGTITVTGSARTAAGLRGSRDTTVAVLDTEAPFVQMELLNGSSNLEPGDTLRLEFSAHDNIRLARTSLRVTGIGFMYADTVDVPGTVQGATRVVSIPIPSSTRLGLLQVVGEAMDYVDNHSAPFLLNIQYNDHTDPTLDVSLAGGHNGVSYAPGDSLIVNLSARDNYKLARVGYVLSAPASLADSMLTSADSNVQRLAFPVVAGWAGTSQLTVFAVDSVGRRTTTVRQIPVDTRSRRPIFMVGTDTVRDVAFDERRGQIYLSHPPSSIRVIDIASAAFVSPWPLAAVPGGIDLTVSGDSLLIGQPNGRILIRSLLTADTTSRRVLPLSDSRPIGKLRVLDNSLVVFEALGLTPGALAMVTGYQWATGVADTTFTFLERSVMGRSSDRRRLVLGAGNPCCASPGRIYDTGLDRWTESGTLVGSVSDPSLDYRGDRVMVGSSLFNRTLAPISLTVPTGATAPAVVAGDGQSAFWPTATGVSQVRFSDGAVLESFTLNNRPTRLYLSPDGLTLLAVLPSSTVAVIDLW